MSIFSLVPIEVLQDENLTATEIKMLVCLLSFRNKTTNLMCPSTEKIAQRMGWKDKTRVSKVTKSLCEKEWLKKKKRGFDTSNGYEITIPEKFVKHGENNQVGENSQIGEKVHDQIGQNSQVQIGENSQPNRQSNKQSNRQDNTLDFSALNLSETLINEILEIRTRNAKAKNRKATPMSQRIINSLAKNFNKAFSMGYSIDEILEHWDSKGWLAFDASWLQPKNLGGSYGTSNQFTQPASRKSLQQRANESEQAIQAYAASTECHGTTLEGDDQVIRSSLDNQPG